MLNFKKLPTPWTIRFEVKQIFVLSVLLRYTDNNVVVGHIPGEIYRAQPIYQVEIVYSVVDFRCIIPPRQINQLKSHVNL